MDTIEKKMNDIVIYGAGGLGREVACLLNLINETAPKWNLVGFLDDDEKIWGSENKYGIILGGADWINRNSKPMAVVIAVGSPAAVRAITSKINNPYVDFPNIIAPSVTFLDKESVSLGKGNVICSSCLISCNVSMGDFNLLNGSIPIGHEAMIGSYNVIMPSTNISGGVVIGNGNFLGVKSTVLQYVKIGDDVRVGAGSVVMRNTKDGNLYMGNPATKVKL